jgi:hypothetical protein
VKSDDGKEAESEIVRRVYFSFDYERDLQRVNKIRQLPGLIAGAAAGFQSTKVWEDARRRGDAAVQGLISDALNNTSVTVVCIGHMTSHRKYVIHEIERSLERGNGLLGVAINHLGDGQGSSDPEGKIPPLLTISGAEVHKYTDKRNLAAWIEQADHAAAARRQHDYQRQVPAQASPL